MYSITCNPRYRNNLVKYLNNNGVGASVHFDPPLHQQNLLKNIIIKMINWLIPKNYLSQL